MRALDSKATCWTVIRGAAAGHERERDEFAQRYLPVVRAYLGARWKNSPLRADVDDTTQEVFVTCFRSDGPLARVDPDRPFRPFFYGVVRNVAREHERKKTRNKEQAPLPDDAQGDDDGLSTIFDRAWAMSMLTQAVQRHKEIAADPRDVELLRLRFEENLPIREIAKRWDMDAAKVHKRYARARDTYKTALTEVVAFHHPGTPGEVERECGRLLALFK
jgi:RNA polymerase sigma-70 factor (ECF subfamily)